MLVKNIYWQSLLYKIQMKLFFIAIRNWLAGDQLFHQKQAENLDRIQKTKPNKTRPTTETPAKNKSKIPKHHKTKTIWKSSERYQGIQNLRFKTGEKGNSKWIQHSTLFSPSGICWLINGIGRENERINRK